jgi:hypothetical protein
VEIKDLPSPFYGCLRSEDGEVLLQDGTILLQLPLQPDVSDDDSSYCNDDASDRRPEY